MPDNKKLRGKADSRRVALEQQHEREYVITRLRLARYYAKLSLSYAGDAISRLSSGYPATTKASKRRGK